jgi:nicotinamide-nucleotide amidase
MRGAILAIGDELTNGVTADTNSAWLAARLAERGIAVGEMRIAPDDRIRIAQAIAELTQSCNLLVITGGLGPTPDDLTREALGDVVAPGEALEVDERALGVIREFFGRAGRNMPPSNARQAERPRGARLLPNEVGTAPGLEVEWRSCRIVSMPGVPHEMKPMFERFASESLPGISRRVRAVHTFGIGESDLASRLGDLLGRDRTPVLGTAAGHGGVSVRAYGVAESDVGVERAFTEVERVAGAYAYGRDGMTLAMSLGQLLQSRNLTLALAESCTGGLLGGLLTEGAGSSAWLRGGWITYSDELKSAELRIAPETIARHGAVSRVVAVAMAEGALRRAAADIALAVTGIAGPSGGIPQKPVGTVYIACSLREGKSARTSVRHFQYMGERHEVRVRAAQSAMQMARFSLLGPAAESLPLLREFVSTGAPK